MVIEWPHVLLVQQWLDAMNAPHSSCLRMIIRSLEHLLRIERTGKRPSQERCVESKMAHFVLHAHILRSSLRRTNSGTMLQLLTL